jgi:ATP-dependent 26S proteasome regulatory subunit
MCILVPLAHRPLLSISLFARAGKTLLARALANNIKASYLKVVASAIVDKYIGQYALRVWCGCREMWISASCSPFFACFVPSLVARAGESARIVREMFGYAKDHQPCVIFMVRLEHAASTATPERQPFAVQPRLQRNAGRSRMRSWCSC